MATEALEARTRGREAAVQALPACVRVTVDVMRHLGLDPDIANVNGGAIALGHPMGATGAKLTATLSAEMIRRRVRHGMVSMYIAGGMGAAAVSENVRL